MAIDAEAVRTEIRQHIRNIVELFSGRGRKAALLQAARALQMSKGRVKQLFYGEAMRIDAHEADNIRAYIKTTEKLIQARAQYDAQCREFIETHSLSGLSSRERN